MIIGRKNCRRGPELLMSHCPSFINYSKFVKEGGECF